MAFKEWMPVVVNSLVLLAYGLITAMFIRIHRFHEDVDRAEWRVRFQHQEETNERLRAECRDVSNRMARMEARVSEVLVGFIEVTETMQAAANMPDPEPTQAPVPAASRAPVGQDHVPDQYERLLSDKGGV